MAPGHGMRLDERLHDNGCRNDTVALLPHATRMMAARDEDGGGCDWRITVHKATSPPPVCGHGSVMYKQRMK
ncbi:gas vesicle protein [Sesbania bispinosa]|nr:gas vesicle protein [Sesbania bispinosa]